MATEGNPYAAPESPDISRTTDGQQSAGRLLVSLLVMLVLLQLILVPGTWLAQLFPARFPKPLTPLAGIAIHAMVTGAF